MTTMCRNFFDVRVPIQTVVNVLNAVDKDKDNCVSIGEVIAFLKAVAKCVRNRAKECKTKGCDE